MAGQYKAYPEYKDSGVEWISRIPSHWVCKPLKRNFKIVNGSTPKSGEKTFWDGDITWVTPADLSKVSINIADSSKKITERGLNSCGASIVPKHSLILSTRAPIGTIAIAGKSLCTNQGCKSLVSTNQIENKFFFYALVISGKQLNNLGKGTTFLELSSDELANYFVPSPNIEEQQKIVTFLDHETAKIDTLIAKQEKLIELLKEKRQAVISHAVTKGLNPDVPMKDSGVEWLGEVPEHWDVLRINLLFNESNQRAFSQDELEYPVLSVSIHNGISDKEMTEGELERKVQRSEDRSLYKVVRSNYLAYNMMRAWQGGFGAATLDGLVSPAYVVCQPKTDLDSYFFELVLRTPNAVTELKKYSRGITDFRLRLYWDEFKNICVPVPSKDEIKLILREISLINTKYEKLEHLAKQQIELLTERRTALISAAVTGKIDVRDWQPPVQAEALEA